MRENSRIYVQISGPNSNFRIFQDKFQNFSNFRTTPRPVIFLDDNDDVASPVKTSPDTKLCEMLRQH